MDWNVVLIDSQYTSSHSLPHSCHPLFFIWWASWSIKNKPHFSSLPFPLYWQEKLWFQPWLRGRNHRSLRSSLMIMIALKLSFDRVTRTKIIFLGLSYLYQPVPISSFDMGPISYENSLKWHCSHFPMCTLSREKVRLTEKLYVKKTW